MKPIAALILAAALALSFAACRKPNGGGTATAPSGTQKGATTDPQKGQPKSALELLETIWSKYPAADKFPATGGSEEHMKDGGPENSMSPTRKPSILSSAFRRRRLPKSVMPPR